MADEPREAAPAPGPKTILLPSRDTEIAAFIAAASPVPVNVTSNPSAQLGPSDLGILIVDKVDPALRAAATRLLSERIPYVVLVQRDVWRAASGAVHKLLDEIQQDPRRKLIRFWRDRAELEQTLRNDVLTLDDSALVRQTMGDGAFVRVGSIFEQTWELENTGFRVWNGRWLKELAGENLTPERDPLPISRTEPGKRVAITARFAAPAGPSSCRSVWQMVDHDGRLSFPWAPGIWCRVLSVF